MDKKDLKNEEHTTALHLAVLSNQARSIERVIEDGVNLNEINCPCGMTALQLAVKLNLADIVEVLIEKGADVNIKLHKGIRDFTPLITAMEEDNVAIVRALLDAGADPNQPESEGKPPLIIAIEEDKIEIVKQLLTAGAELLSSDEWGETTLHYAARYSVKSVELLLSLAVDVNVVRKPGYWKSGSWRRFTPLMAAAEDGNLPTLRLLLNKGANVNLTGRNMKTALHFANSCCAVLMLWERGADIAARDVDRMTSLHLATRKQYLGVIEALLFLGPPTSDYGPFIRNFVPEEFGKVYQIFIKFHQIHYNNVMYASLDLSDFYYCQGFDILCSREVQQMKDTEFGEISLFRMIVKRLTAYKFAKNKEICKFIENDQFQNQFPLYHTILRRRLRIAKRRLSLIGNLISMFTALIEDSLILTLPEEVCDEVFSYLSSADLIHLNCALDYNFVIEGEVEDMSLHSHDGRYKVTICTNVVLDLSR